ncbi:MAG TPA: DUF502 domain-containing protein [Syntrophales bacterium]|jgi:uncharacterized membrane protein|nr:DUF502 domain-containing protein [Syntrophales bacterium]
MGAKMGSRLGKRLKNIFLTGLAVIIPIGLTLYILFFIIDVMDGLLKIIPDRYEPDALLGFHVPGLGIIFTVLLILITGLITKSYVGNMLVKTGEGLFGKIPIVRSIYLAIKQIFNSLFVGKSRSFRKVVLIEYPGKGLYSIGFVTGSPEQVFSRIAGGHQDYVGVFVPLALTPTTGFFVMVKQSEVIEMDMTVEEAFTLIISAGIVPPKNRANGGEQSAGGDIK